MVLNDELAEHRRGDLRHCAEHGHAVEKARRLCGRFGDDSVGMSTTRRRVPGGSSTSASVARALPAGGGSRRSSSRTARPPRAIRARPRGRSTWTRHTDSSDSRVPDIPTREPPRDNGVDDGGPGHACAEGPALHPRTGIGWELARLAGAAGAPRCRPQRQVSGGAPAKDQGATRSAGPRRHPSAVAR